MPIGYVQSKAGKINLQLKCQTLMNLYRRKAAIQAFKHGTWGIWYGISEFFSASSQLAAQNHNKLAPDRNGTFLQLAKM